MNSVNSERKYIGLLGYPLGHSFSPDMQNAAFRNRNVNYVYKLIEVKPADFPSVAKALPSMDYEGFNVTIPYKVEIIRYLDEIDEAAKCIGAVNTVVIKDGKLKGYNTDGIGFLRSLEESMGSGVEGKNIFVLGSGGASRAICMISALNKARKIFICNRTFEKAIALAEDINKYVPESSIALPMECDEMSKTIRNADVFINTTSVGTFPKVDEIPIDSSLLNKKLIVYDVIYNPQKTKLLLEAEKLGCKTISGLGMLVYQGAEAFELWTGKKAPADLMFDVLSEVLRKKEH